MILQNGYSVASDGRRWVIGGNIYVGTSIPIYSNNLLGASGWTSVAGSTVSGWLTNQFNPSTFVSDLSWNGHQWLAVVDVIDVSYNSVYSSQDGITWQATQTGSLFDRGRSLTWNSAAWIITGGSTISTNDNTLKYSTNNAVTWQSVTSYRSPATAAVSNSIASRLVVPLLNPSGTVAGNILLSGATSQLGFAGGAGGSVTQGATGGKGAGVTINNPTGTIVMNNAGLEPGATVNFTLSNSTIAATDMVIVQHVFDGTAGAYTFTVFPASGSAVIYVRNFTENTLGEAIVLRFMVIKSANS
jgi:hypothetical protein